MKRVMVSALVFVISIIATATLLYFNAFLIFCGFYAVPPISAALTSFGTAGLYKSLCVKNWVSMVMFRVLAFLLQSVIGIGTAVVFVIGFFGSFNVRDYIWEMYDFFSICFTYGFFGLIFTYSSAGKIKGARR